MGSRAVEPPTRVIVIAATPRTGSNLLSDAMAATGRFGAPTEYLSERQLQIDAHGLGRPRYTWRAHAGRVRRRLRGDPDWRWIKAGGITDASLERILDDLAGHQSPNGVMGLKIMWHHYDALFVGRGHSPDRWGAPVTWIRIRRRDRVRQAISHSRAIATGQFVATHEATGEAVYDRDVITRLRKDAERTDAAWDAHLAGLDVEPHQVVYEDLDADHEGTLRRLFDDLGEPDVPVPPRRLQRQADEVTEEWVARYLAETDEPDRGRPTDDDGAPAR